jgi:hypothetical protein
MAQELMEKCIGFLIDAIVAAWPAWPSPWATGRATWQGRCNRWLNDIFTRTAAFDAGVAAVHLQQPSRLTVLGP